MQCKFLLQTMGVLGIVLSACTWFKSSTPSSDDVSAPCSVQDSTKGTQLMETTKWQEFFLDAVCKDSTAQEGWGLFDQGGFAGMGGFGQVMVIGGSKELRLLYVKLGSSSLEPTQSIKGAKQEDFKKSVESLSSSLQDRWDEGFDMVENEFIHVEKKDRVLTVTKRIRWRIGRDCKEHCELAKTFETLFTNH